MMRPCGPTTSSPSLMVAATAAVEVLDRRAQTLRGTTRSVTSLSTPRRCTTRPCASRIGTTLSSSRTRCRRAGGCSAPRCRAGRARGPCAARRGRDAADRPPAGVAGDSAPMACCASTRSGARRRVDVGDRLVGTGPASVTMMGTEASVSMARCSTRRVLEPSAGRSGPRQVQHLAIGHRREAGLEVAKPAVERGAFVLEPLGFPVPPGPGERGPRNAVVGGGSTAPKRWPRCCSKGVM